MLAEVWTEGKKAWLGKAAKNWASAPEVSRPEGALLHSWFCLDTFLKVRHNWHNRCTDFLKNETCSLILKMSRNYSWSSDRSRSKEQTQGLSSVLLCVCLHSRQPLLSRSQTDHHSIQAPSELQDPTSNRGPGPDSQGRVGPQAQPWANQCPGRWNALIGPGLGHTPLLELVMGSP